MDDVKSIRVSMYSDICVVVEVCNCVVYVFMTVE